MKKVLILMGRYLPGYKDGGPVRTIKNLTDLLGNEYDIRIMCHDRDHGDKVPYSNINVNTYNKVGNAKVYYVKDGKFTLKTLLNEIKKVDIVYCCGPYDNYAIKTIFLKRLGLFNQNLVVASMGSFSKGALSIKSKKKIIFLNIMKKLGFFKKIIWSVTSNIEEKELKEVIGNQANCIIAEDLPRTEIVKHKRIKEKNKLKIIFLSRICEMKNLSKVIDIISKISKFEIQFDIYGNKEDMSYWNKCEKKLLNLPKNINWKYCGECKSENVLDTFSKYDVFLFPTLGENYGHVIGEALLAGCIPIISNKTPWSDLDNNNCGNIVQLEDFDKFIRLLNFYIKMDDKEFKKYVYNAQHFVLKKNKKIIKNTGYVEVFNI